MTPPNRRNLFCSDTGSIERLQHDTGDNRRLAEHDSQRQDAAKQPTAAGCRFATIASRIRSPGTARARTRGMFETMSATVLCFGEILLRLSSPGKELLLQSARFDVARRRRRSKRRGVIEQARPRRRDGEQRCRNRRSGTRAQASCDVTACTTDAIRFCDGRMGLYFLTHGAGHRPAEVLYDRAGSAFAAAQRRRLRLECAARRLQLAARFRYHARRQQFRRRSRATTR